MTFQQPATLSAALTHKTYFVGLLPSPAVGDAEGVFFPIEGDRRVFLCVDGSMTDERFDALMGYGKDTEVLNDEDRNLLRGYNAVVADGGGQDIKEGLTWNEVYEAMEASGFKAVKDFEWVGWFNHPEYCLCPKGSECCDDWAADAASLQEVLDEAVRRQ